MNTKQRLPRGENVTVFEKDEWSIVRYEGFGRTSNGANWSVYYMGQFFMACSTKKRCVDYINRQTLK